MYSRRRALLSTGCGFGYLAFTAMATEVAVGAEGKPLSREPHFTPKAKRVIFLCMRGGPSHVDTFDYKPELEKFDGKSPVQQQPD